MEAIELIKVLLLCSDQTKATEISREMLIELIDRINKNGMEYVTTDKGTYYVKGIIIGEVKNKIIIS